MGYLFSSWVNEFFINNILIKLLVRLLQNNWWESESANIWSTCVMCIIVLVVWNTYVLATTFLRKTQGAYIW